MNFEKHLEQLANLENVSIDTEATHETTGEKLKDQFCKHYPDAKAGHEIALAMVKNPIAKIIISLGIAILDAVAKRICTAEEGK